MPTVTKPAGQQNVPSIERPLAHSFAPHALMGEYLMMIPLMPSHQYNLHADIFSQPQVMRYCGTGSSFTGDEYTSLHLERAKQNLTPQYNQNTSRVTRFTWTIITRDGIAGVLNISPKQGATELAFCISPTQQGRALARRAGELVIAYTGEDTSFIATAHPKNKASATSIERMHYPNGGFVFFRDAKRQNVPNVYGANQPRDYFVSQRQNECSFFSFNKGRIAVDLSKGVPQAEETYTHKEEQVNTRSI